MGHRGAILYYQLTTDNTWSCIFQLVEMFTFAPVNSLFTGANVDAANVRFFYMTKESDKNFTHRRN